MSDETKACPACGETIKAVAIKCRFCNSDLAALAAQAAAKELEVERPLYEGHPLAVYSAWQWIPIVLTLGIYYLVLWTQSRKTTYRVSTQRIRIERGLLSTDIDNVELFRIDHLDVHRPLGMRLIGQCYLHLRSSDASFPTAILYGIPNILNLADTLRECALRERKRRGVTTFVQA